MVDAFEAKNSAVCGPRLLGAIAAKASDMSQRRDEDKRDEMMQQRHHQHGSHRMRVVVTPGIRGLMPGDNALQMHQVEHRDRAIALPRFLPLSLVRARALMCRGRAEASEMTLK